MSEPWSIGSGTSCAGYAQQAGCNNKGEAQAAVADCMYNQVGQYSPEDISQLWIYAHISLLLIELHTLLF